MPDLSLAAVVLLAAAVQGALGFGFVIVTLGLGALLLPLPTLVPPAAAMSLVLCGTMLVALRAEARPRDALPLLLGAPLGLPIGILLLRAAPVAVLTALLGVALLAAVALELARPARPHGPAFGFSMGALAGVLGGALSVGGPPVVLYAASQPWSPRRAAAAMQVFFLVQGAVQVALYVHHGLLDGPGFTLAWTLLPPAAVGLLVGQLVLRRLPALWFRRSVLAFLAVLGLRFVLRALAG